MIKNKNISERKNFNKSNLCISKKENNFINMSHSKNKSADLKNSKKRNMSLSTLNNNLNNSETKNIMALKNKDKNINKSNFILKNKKLTKSIINNTRNKDNLKNKSFLIKNGSFLNLINKNKKKYFLDSNFFNINSKEKNNLSSKQNSSKKLEDSKNDNINKYKKKIIKRKINNDINNNNINNINNNNYKEKESNIVENEKENIENESTSKNCDISSNENNSILDKDFNIKSSKIKSNLLYIKSKINKIPYKNKNYNTSFCITWNQKENNNNIELNNKRKSVSKINHKLNLLNDSLDSHNTIYDEENINEYQYINNNINKSIFNYNNNKNNESSDKLYKKIIMRKRNLLSQSLNKSKLKDSLPINYSNKNFSFNNALNNIMTNSSERNLSKYVYNLKSNFLYRKINSKQVLTNNKKNYFLSSSFSSTKNQTNKLRDKDKYRGNIIINKDVTEFLYSEDLTDNYQNNKNINLKKWLTDINLSCYYNNFYENNISDLNELIDDINKINEKHKLYEYVENTFHIHIPGHIYRILCKLEIEDGIYDTKIINFLIGKDDDNNKFSKIQPSYLLIQYNNCDNLCDCNCYKNNNIINLKNNLKNYLKIYHLIHLYYNFYQNGFDLINYVLLQMYSNNYVINDYILENYFHIYNKNDRILVLESLLNEKIIINTFLNSDKYKDNENNINLKYEDIYLNSNNSFNNIESYLNGKQYEDNNCNICIIY